MALRLALLRLDQPYDVSVQGSDFNPIGNNIAFLNNDASGSNIFDGTAAITNVATLDSFSNLAAGTLEGDGVTSGSVMKQTFSATAGNTISFTYNFLTNETPATEQDFAYYTLSGPGIGTVTVNVLATPTAPAGSALPLVVDQAGIFNYRSGTGTETGNPVDFLRHRDLWYLHLDVWCHQRHGPQRHLRPAR